MEALVLIASVLVFIALGIPIAVALGLSALVYSWFLGFPPISVLMQRTVMGVNSFVLLALPLFILAGLLMERGGSSERLMRFINALVGHVPGGTGVVTVVGSMFFGALSGSGVATAAAIGQIMEPRMVSEGYKPGFVASLQGGAGLLGAVIPPSIAMVTYGAIAGVSIGALFLGGIIPRGSGRLVADSGDCIDWPAEGLSGSKHQGDTSRSSGRRGWGALAPVDATDHSRWNPQRNVYTH